jgi:hypothetical protein
MRACSPAPHANRASNLPPSQAAHAMKQFDNLTPALEAILINWSRRGYVCWTSFQLKTERVDAKAMELADSYGTRLPAWKRQDRKQAGQPTCVAVSAPILGSPGSREIILMATAEVQTAPAGSVWKRERWSDRCVVFGSFVLTKEPRPRGDYAWTWRLQEHIYEGIRRYLTSLVKAGNASAIRTETEGWQRRYPLFGGVRRQLRRLLNSGEKLWLALQRRPWPGLSSEQLPIKIGFRGDPQWPASSD